MKDWLPGYAKLRARDSKKDGEQSRGLFLLPNLLTTAAIFAGFYAMMQSIDGNFGHAAMAIFIAGLLDGLDGRVARLVNAQSNFGKEYDTISDTISFGVAPALVVYVWALHALGGLGQGTPGTL
jgi:CDP-diacylglycerol--serine O-phosphatidyltransferase